MQENVRNCKIQVIENKMYGTDKKIRARTRNCKQLQ